MLIELPNTFSSVNPWLNMMNSTGLGQQQAAIEAGQQQSDLLVNQMRLAEQRANVKREAMNWRQASNAVAIPGNLYAQLQNVTPLVSPPPKHTAKELTAVALAWVFGDERMAPLLAYEAADTAAALRAPTPLELLRDYVGEPTREQILIQRVYALAAKPWFWPAFGAVALWDVFSWIHHLI